MQSIVERRRRRRSRYIEAYAILVIRLGHTLGLGTNVAMKLMRRWSAPRTQLGARRLRLRRGAVHHAEGGFDFDTPLDVTREHEHRLGHAVGQRLACRQSMDDE